MSNTNTNAMNAIRCNGIVSSSTLGARPDAMAAGQGMTNNQVHGTHQESLLVLSEQSTSDLYNALLGRGPEGQATLAASDILTTAASDSPAGSVAVRDTTPRSTVVHEDPAAAADLEAFMLFVLHNSMRRNRLLSDGSVRNPEDAQALNGVIDGPLARE
ncbi:hypothetical protein C8Q74DRAFT_1216693 [Fomes fomentarius]|nr:hypothetical protein C8Q74DRAFT_1216693 [Fomes fomentarius]